MPEQDKLGICIADTLPKRHPVLQQALAAALAAANETLTTLPDTRDIWARDYMPVPTPSGKLVRFRYAPDYLRGKKWRHLVTDAASVCQQLGLATHETKLILDGGNVVRGPGKVIPTDKVLRENPHIPPAQLTKELAQLLEADQVILLPADPQDFTGHADGIVHFLDEHTVLVNDYRQEKNNFWPRLRAALRVARLEWVPLPYNPYCNSSKVDAAGVYTNFLSTKHKILAPIFGQKEDEPTLRQLEQAFPTHHIQPINCRELAREGGLLHCVTWTVSC